MKKLNLEQMENIEGGFPWWGTYCDYSTPVDSGIYEVGEVGGGHYQEFCSYPCAYYVMGVRVASRPDTREACPTGW
ncbi:hypothetical protein [Pedobacter sp. SL55]|uniref:hypothetical protein n=1 Tax=Pedobacter sp. SL55 TaxID=2995161 RepID=UPI00226ECD04|nr:hypothetical protein [Pedobacter sp. SL55]WAC42106.1 hypothetical protein OVA16_07060 [Pedobacter sp. SL55]